MNLATKNNNPLFITIYAGSMPFNGNTIPSGKSLGGSESGAYYIAKELAALGHTVTVFTKEEKCGYWDNVRYEWCGELTKENPLGNRFAFAMKCPQDVVISQRHPYSFSVPPNSKLNILWLHDLALFRSAPFYTNTLTNTDKIFTVSEFHKQQVMEVWGVEDHHIISTKNGVDYSAIHEAKNESARQKKHICFAARPERGLAELVDEEGIMLDLPDYHLHVCNYNNTTAQMAGFYQHLYSRCEALPNVTLHGHLGKHDLYKLLSRCQLYVYPTMFEDTSNILALEAAACGTPFLGIETGALSETCRSGFARLLPPGKGGVDKKEFVETIHTICEDSYVWERLHNRALGHHQSWGNIAAEWDSIFRGLLTAKSNNKPMLIKHFEQLSDIVAARKIMDDDKIEKILPNFKKDYAFLINDTFKEHYDGLYQYEKDRGVNYGPEVLDGQARYECIADIVKRAKPAVVLDYGCAHGHYTINLAKRFPDIEFHGMDLVQSNIDIANKWAKADKVGNVQFFRGEHIDLRQYYDLIIAAEVLEHVEKPTEVVDTFNEFLYPDGHMVISVPTGPWEAIGYKEHSGWRAHIHHLERGDLFNMFGHFKNYKCLALPHVSNLGSNLGHYVLSFSKPKEGQKCKPINYRRKANRQAPRQSLSACIILKNEEDNIGRCLKCIQDYVDEIIIGIDETTTDATKKVFDMDGISSEKITHFSIPSPLEIGFDEARNLTLAQATSDWILWVDADETIENIHLISKYLRPNPYNGYKIAQHHYGVEPPGILQTDYPCRLFRRLDGVCFVGIVHEHPTAKNDINAGLGLTFQLPDVHIMHTGYATEEKRRNRFKRNFPLLKRDRKKYPDRILGQALFMRDLSHSIRYSMEQSRGVVKEEAINAAIQIVELWQDFLTKKDKTPVRYLIEFLSYYSHAVSIIAHGKEIDFNCTINGQKIEGKFPNTQIIKNFVSYLTDEVLRLRDKKYW